MGESKEGGSECYRSAIASDEQRVVLNGLTRECIDHARFRNERLRFSSKGVDAFSSARKFLRLKGERGAVDPETVAAERVFDFDVLTALFEETEDVHLFSVSYPVIDGRVMMGALEWKQLAANGALDERTESWYAKRAFVEAREAVIAEQLITSGELKTHDIITISNTPTAADASEYFSGRDLMIRHTTYDSEAQVVHVNTLKMHAVATDVLERLFAVLNVSVDEQTVAGSEDESAKFLATNILVTKNQLHNGAADVGFLIDCILSETNGQQYLFGEVVDGVRGNPYAELFTLSQEKEQRREAAVQEFKANFLEMVERGTESLERQKQLLEMARAHVAEIEGTEFVEERYGAEAARYYQAKQKAIVRGDMQGAVAAEQHMQHEMGDPVICGTVMRSGSSRPGGGGGAAELVAFCPRLPRPGEITDCPCCRKRVRVEGDSKNSEKIFCSNKKCKLSNPKKQQNADFTDRLLSQRSKKRKQPKREKILV